MSLLCVERAVTAPGSTPRVHRASLPAFLILCMCSVHTLCLSLTHGFNLDRRCMQMLITGIPCPHTHRCRSPRLELGGGRHERVHGRLQHRPVHGQLRLPALRCDGEQLVVPVNEATRQQITIKLSCALHTVRQVVCGTASKHTACQAQVSQGFADAILLVGTGHPDRSQSCMQTMAQMSMLH